MKQVILGCEEHSKRISDIHRETPIFARDRDGVLVGMVVYEPDGWIVKVGYSFGSYGHRDNRIDLIEYGQSEMGYTFHVDC